MKEIIVSITLIAAIIFSLSGCDKTDEVQKQLIRKWKLEKIVYSFYDPERHPDGPPTYYYSDNNVFYEFKKNEKLVISSDIDDERFDRGEYTFTCSFDTDEYSHKYVCFDDGVPWYYRVDGNSIILDNSPMDGPTYYFTRVK